MAPPIPNRPNLPCVHVYTRGLKEIGVPRSIRYVLKTTKCDPGQRRAKKVLNELKRSPGDGPDTTGNGRAYGRSRRNRFPGGIGSSACTSPSDSKEVSLEASRRIFENCHAHGTYTSEYGVSGVCPVCRSTVPYGAILRHQTQICTWRRKRREGGLNDGPPAMGGGSEGRLYRRPTGREAGNRVRYAVAVAGAVA